MIRKKPAPDLIRGVKRFFDKIMLNSLNRPSSSIRVGPTRMDRELVVLVLEADQHQGAGFAALEAQRMH